MRFVDFSFDDPAKNLALEEVLLDRVEGGEADSTLRLWESAAPFVVLGTSQALGEEVQEDACRRDGVPILRRCTAGGCVLQGPGCLNFSLALSYNTFPGLKGLHASYRLILERIAAAFLRREVEVQYEGVCDLALPGGFKVSGNAQRRRRNAMLHHGTLLYRPDCGGMARYLREPAKRPEYRGGRTHGEFVRGLPLPVEGLRATLCEAFAPSAAPTEPDDEELEAAGLLADRKYRSDDWTRRR